MDVSSLSTAVRRVVSRLGCSRAELAALAVLAAGAVALLGILWLRTPGGGDAEAVGGASGAGGASVAADRDADQGATPEPGASAAPMGAADEVVVHVAGAVASPGLYELPGGARVADALEAAGGATGDAVLDHVNLAREVSDGEHLLVPDAATQEEGGGDGRRSDGRVDVNRATADELEQLPGVGPVTAQRIVEHRDAHGPFADPRDLLEVSGIGERTLESLIDDIGT